jgi:hypothetical protein
MKIEKTEYHVSGSQSVNSLSNNLKIHGYDIRYAIGLVPVLLDDNESNTIELKWEMELGSGKTIHYWYYTLQRWAAKDIDNQFDMDLIRWLVDESYIYFYKAFMNDKFHIDAIPNMVFPKLPTDAPGFDLEITLKRLEAVFSDLIQTENE